VLIWFATASVAITFLVFQSPAIDYRLVALGAVIPSIEVPFGAGLLHTLAAPTLVLIVVMAATSRKRLLRRQWLGLPIGMYLHLVLDLAAPDTFWWPFRGAELWSEPAPELSRGAWTLILELLGVGIGAWAYRRFGLDNVARRHKFLTTGQLDRSVMGGAPRT
jgi:membrane-bound metal-dependent hydrolase YbcI (DUF457 family)